MKQLAVIDDADFGLDAVSDRSDYWHRQAVRAVVLDSAGRIYLMRVGKRHSHKLPGGGIDEGEDRLVALERELMEEVGVRVELIAELGELIEYRGSQQMKQTSYCYLVRQVGDKVANSLEVNEIANEMSEILVDDIDQAIALLDNDKPSDLGARFMLKRDLVILRTARPVIGQFFGESPG